MADPISGLQNLYGDITTKPGETLGNLWGSFTSAAPGLGIPGGGVPGAFTSASKYSPSLMRLVDQLGKLRMNPSSFQQSPVSKVVQNPEHPFAREIATAMPKAYEYAEKSPTRVIFGYLDPMQTLAQGPVGETGKTTSGAIATLKSHPAVAAEYFNRLRGLVSPEEFRKAIDEYARSGLHEFQHVIDRLALAKKTGSPDIALRGGKRAEQLAETVGKRYPVVKEWYDLVSPSYLEQYAEQVPTVAPRVSAATEPLVEGAAKHLQELIRRRAATP